jgi:hypothetical protein
MATDLAYICKGNQDTGPGSTLHSTGLPGDIAMRIDAHDGPWKLEGPGAGNAWRSHRFAKRHFAEVIVSNGALGDVYHMVNQAVTINYRVVSGLTTGEKMLADEKLHFGDDYLLGGNAPGPSDCSGWTLYEVKKYAGITLPHYTVTQFQALGGNVGAYPELHQGSSSLGSIFADESKCKPSDFVFKSYPDFATASDNPDHVGLWVAPGIMRDTRSVSERLADRTIDVGLGQTFYGRIFAINGQL